MRLVAVFRVREKKYDDSMYYYSTNKAKEMKYQNIKRHESIIAIAMRRNNYW